MTEYIVVANKLNFRDSAVGGAVLAVLPRGFSVTGDPVPGNADWLAVTAFLPSTVQEMSGFVSAAFVEPEDSPPLTAAASFNLPTLPLMKKLAPNGREPILQAVVDEIPTTGESFGLTASKLVMCHFLAQACHESAYFRTTREYWGPTPAQRRYEGRADLGNTKSGDGKRYMGRGIFQLTGRANYRAMGPKLGLDLEGNPDLAADPRTSFRIACHYWAGRKIGMAAAANDIVKVTKLINGGRNGLADRIALFDRAMRIF